MPTGRHVGTKGALALCNNRITNQEASIMIVQHVQHQPEVLQAVKAMEKILLNLYSFYKHVPPLCCSSLLSQ
jgi:hypothetical protein